MTDDIESLRNEALRKIGRNVVNFQKIETALKVLIVATKVEGTPNDLASRQANKAAAIHNQTLGALAEAFYKHVYKDGGSSEGSENPSDIWISTSFGIEGDPTAIKEEKRTLLALVAERNKLIHKDLGSFDHNSVESCSHLIAVLDEQNKRILQQLDRLKWIIDIYKQVAEEVREWIDSDEFLQLLQRELHGT